MDPAWLFPLSLQHPNLHQHLQQQHWQHLQQQQLSPVSSAARVIPFVPKTRATERQTNRVDWHPGKEQHAVQHLPAQENSFQILLPAVYPPPLHLQPLSPGEPVYRPYSSQQSYWLPVPTYSYNAQPYIQLPFSSFPEVKSRPGHLPPILCPQIVLLPQTHCADQVYISSPAEVTTASQWTEVHAGSGGEGSMSCAKEDQKNNPHKGNPGNDADPGNESNPGNDANPSNDANTVNESKTPKENIPASLTEDCDFPGPTASLDEEAVNKHSIEECFSLLERFFDQLLPTQAEDPREEEHGEAGYLNMENSSFLEYMDELCRDEEFVSKVESTVNIEALMPPLSASQDLFEEQEQEMILQEELPPCPANSNHFYGETPPVSSQSLFLDAPGSLFASSPNRNRQNSAQNEVGISCSPLLLSNLLEEPPSPSHNPLDASDAFSQDDCFASILHLFPDQDFRSDDTLNSILSFLDRKTTAPPAQSSSPHSDSASHSGSATLKVKCNFSHFEKTQELNNPRGGETKSNKKQPSMNGGEKSVTTKTLDQEVQASEENQTKPKTNILEALAEVLKRTRGTEKDKEKKKLQKKQGTQSFKRKRSRETKLMSTAEQFLEPTKKKQHKSPNVEDGMHGELTFTVRHEDNARASGSLPNTCPESTNTFQGIFRDTMPQVQKSPASNNQASPDLTVSPAKKHTRGWQAGRKRGRSGENAGTAMEQLEQSPTKKSRKAKRS